MRVAIIAPSVMGAIDGVSDHVEKLVQCLHGEGHELLAIGINDFHENTKEFSEKRDGVQFVNFSSHSAWGKRSEKLIQLLEAFAPEAISVQFYWRGFWADKTPGEKIARFLRKIGGRKCRRHMMYHETWEEVGSTSRIPVFARHLVLSTRIARFHHSFSPHTAFTNTAHYAQQLRRIAVRAKVWGIPSTFSVVPHDPVAEAEVWKQIQEAGAGKISLSEAWVAVFFGRIQPEWNAEAAMPWLKRIQKFSKRRHGLIISVGKTSYGDHGWRRVTTAAEAAGFSTAKLGMQEPDFVSRVFALSDFGIVVTEGRLLKKNSSYSAIREHGLPVFLNEVDALTDEEIDGFFVLPGAEFERTLAAAKRTAPPPDRWVALCKAYEAAFSSE